MGRADSFEKTLMLGKIEGRRKRDDRGSDGWMASLTQWTWVWANSERWWTGKSGVLQSMGFQRVRHDLANEQFNTVTSNSFSPHGMQHTRPPHPSPTSGVYSNSCSLSRWCHPTISFSVTPFPPALNLSQHQGLFQWIVSSHQVAKILELQFQHQSFNEYSGLIFFRID